MRRKQRNPRRAADPIYVDDVPVCTVSELRSENTRLRKTIELLRGRVDRRNAQIVLVVEQYNRAMTGYRDAVSDLARLRKRARTTLSYWRKTHRDARQCISDTAYDVLTGWDSEREAGAERKEREERAMEYLRCKFSRRGKMRRACLQCGAMKTPQWRMGPRGKKTLCNACGVKHLKRERILNRDGTLSL